MLRLHNTEYDVILFGLLSEITEYARYAYEGNHNEHEHQNNLAGDAGHHRTGGQRLGTRRLARLRYSVQSRLREFFRRSLDHDSINRIQCMEQID